MDTTRLLALDLQRDSSQAKHERLRDHFISELRVGRLKPGQAIPTEQSLMETLGVARATIRQAMASLENDGLIRRVQGKGTFVEDDVRRKLKRGQDIYALVTPETHGGFYPSLLHGFETAASSVRHQAIVCSTDFDVSRQGDIILQLLDKEVGGVAIVPTVDPPTPAYQPGQLQKRGIPVVFCHRRVEGIDAPLLVLPYYDVGYKAGSTLAAMGHRRVAFISPYHAPSIQAYQTGLQDALKAMGGQVPAEFVFKPSFSDREDDFLSALGRMFGQPNPPTAIFTTFDSQAETIYFLLPRLGLRVPEDVSLVGFGGSWREGAMMRRLTSVVVDEVATGRRAVSLLHEMRQGQRPIDDNEEFVLEVELYQGETLATPSPIVRPII